MNLKPKTVILALCLSLVFIVIWMKLVPENSINLQAPVSTPSSTNLNQTRENSGGNVTVSITPVRLTPGTQPQFQIAFETHSVELDFDVAKITTLTDQQGQQFPIPIWDGAPPGGHHRQGILTFPQTLNTSVKSLNLTLTDIAGIPERKFTWDLNPK
ncbi:MAG: hypothetical protein UV61_C0009G0038 [Candidatus Gottesmanbacteria bacterium GW2011_GWB1_43_11]|uniref:Uncharacterized protein n=1 Tax=Candidatus Gottesmanbacteria bacterium GW2011_GWB1_43_11 TaxID=1618446 RepID=A0A0G1ETT7_9BACT|nr:MAG: hypothetical protein UV17_C0031G0009 [Candidatus Gottesmanbacteria bacterium GW2011_GWA1_42_26]KKS81392.1 MAG: hypothetical protein UV55_C0015G0038 [Candidatus Gottesmanbacteria bacterium GW2011_GWC1_43_10]KKS86511.1 MAG: hypothetical protein UV61_C0009G0038 [Candidatus Gottesmanbacteria bacterium GW2011_GWB1_43_11]OGG07468.1 MAG: hypothetical protein A2699_03075 [Candidatus Gottesmanbacteria bacterium RIFCSPHIGHO2_01_FULL_43_15]OGG26514.1 MAG: hypothetical protein A3A59_06170 [Candidat